WHVRSRRLGPASMPRRPSAPSRRAHATVGVVSRKAPFYAAASGHQRHEPRFTPERSQIVVGSDQLGAVAGGDGLLQIVDRLCRPAAKAADHGAPVPDLRVRRSGGTRLAKVALRQVEASELA